MTTKCIEIPAPPFSKVGRKIESQTRKALYEFDLIESPKIAIALSGGKDSLTLLFMLKAISSRGFLPLELRAIHVSGEFSCGAGVADSYLKQLCDKAEVPLSILHSPQADGPTGCYSCSRERRRLIFQEAKKHGFHQIAFGHHRDDSIETLLLNLFHKGEFAANLAKVPMHHFGLTIIRPLIFVSEELIRAFAEHQGFLRFMCQCPIGATSKRRDVKNLLDSLEADFPNVRHNLSLAALNYGSDKAARS